MADTYITNITTDTTDSAGNYLIGSNDVLSVFYYDVTATGTAWTTEWNIVNPISNNSFSDEISATDWVLDTDGAGDIQLDRFAGWKSTDLVEGLTVTSSGSHSPYSDDYITDYYNDYGWETTNATPSGAYAATIDMGSVQDFNYVYILPGWDTDTTKFLKDYRIGVSDTGAEDDFTIVHTGTTSGTLAPEIAFVGNDVSGQYVKLYVDSNYGSVSYSRVGKFSVFNNPDWSMFGYRNFGAAAGSTYAEWKQDVFLSNIDTLFFDIRGYNLNAYQVGEVKLIIDSDEVATYDWSSTGAVGWKDDTYDGGWWTRLEEKIDVSGYTGTKTVEIVIWSGSYDRSTFMAYIDNLSVQPRWYSESSSSSRGELAEFPTEVFIISDREGLSILNKSDNSLWMRFDVGSGKALEAAARDVFAADGKIYLATSRGVVVIDFIDNRIWKYDETGVYYRMSIAERNEYAFWFTDNVVDLLDSSDIYSVHGGYWKESAVAPDDTLNVLVGTGAGMSIIYPSNIYNSSFSYSVRKIRKYDDRVVYIGGFGSLSKVCVMETMSSLWSDSFDEQAVLYSHVDMVHDDSFDSTISAQWDTAVAGNLGLIPESGYFTISGTKDDYGDTVIIQKEFTPSRPFSASVDVKINEWSDRVEGGLHFGVTSGWPYFTDRFDDGDKALMLGAVNGINGPYIQNESFSSFPNHNNWVQNFTDWDDQKVEVADDSYKVSGYLVGSYGTSYSTGPVTGSKYYWPATGSFIARIKTKVTDFYSVDVGRVFGFVFGVTDGQYLGQGAGTTGVAMALHGGNVVPNPPVYCTAHKTNNSGWIWNTTASGSLFAGDGTAAADWHQWEIRYDEPSNTLYGSVDGISVGSITYGSIGSDLGIVFGPVGNQIDYVEVSYKDFEIDFGELVGNQKEKYVLHSYDSGAWSMPTLSGTHLDGVDFSTTDRTPSAEWRTWNITYDGTTLSGSVDGAYNGAAVSLDLSGQPRIFMAYDAPATLSGTNNSVDINVRNFRIAYDVDNTVVSGSPNSFYFDSGTYNTVNYNTLYLATTSGIEQIMYIDGTPVSGMPDDNYFYSIEGGGAEDRELIFGNIKNCSAVESESGAVGPRGLLYLGTSRYKNMGWSRLKDRPSEEEADLSMSIMCTTDGSKLVTSINRSGGSSHYIYIKDVGTDGGDWHTIAVAEPTVGFQEMQDSRAYGCDFEDGNIHFVGPAWFGIYNIADEVWVLPNDNVGTGGVSTSIGEPMEGCEATSALARAVMLFSNSGGLGLYSVKDTNWRYGKLFYNAEQLPLSTADSAIVYSDVDDSLYIMQYQATGTSNFFRMPMSTLIVSSALEDCPVPYNFTKGISAFYRPQDESVYYLMLGTDAATGRKLVRYDVKAAQWEAWGIDIPATAYDFLTGSYSYKEDALFVVVGSESARVYKYLFPRDEAPRYVFWDAVDGVLPEQSIKARFNRVSFSSGYAIGDDSFSDSDFGTKWNVFASHATGTTVTEDDTSATFYNAYSVTAGQAMVGSSALLPPCDFTATAKVKITDVRKSSDASNNNNFIFGVSDYIGSPGYFSATNEDSEMGNTMAGVNGLWMNAYNDLTTSERYSLWRRELGTDTKYSSTDYELFNSTDGTPIADYRDWKIEYTHSTASFSAYIDDNLIGSTSFTGDGFEHGVVFSIGSYCPGVTSISGELIVDVKDFVITTDDSVSMVSNYLQLDDLDLYGYNFYEKFDCTLASGTDYAYEVECRLINDSVTDNVYLTSLGAVEDGNKNAVLAAISTGTRQIGIYSGGDPTELTSYTGLTAQDWSIQATYTMVHDDDRLKVYVDGSDTASIDIAYTDLPGCYNKRVRFGSFNPYESELRHHYDRNGLRVTVSGTWAEDNTKVSAYFGSCVKASTSSDAMIYRFNEAGDHSVYVFYPAGVAAAEDSPYTVYHNGVVTLPTDDSYATTPVNTVSDNVNESGAADPNTTTIEINQRKLADGDDYNAIDANGSDTPSGWVYIGTYTDVDRVVQTGDVAGSSAYADTVKITRRLQQPQAISTARIYNVGYTIGETQTKTDSDYVGAFSVLDMDEKLLLDAYNDETTPDIVGSDISDLDVMV